jgi:hypothetical protein
MRGVGRTCVAVAAAVLVALAVSPSSAHPHGYYGGAYRSVDGGTIWMDLNRTYPVGAVYDLSAPKPPRVWEATDKGLLRTLDGGITWTRVGPRALGDVLRVVSEDPADSSVLAGGQRGLFWAPADLSVWERVLTAPVMSLTRDEDDVLVRTARDWHVSHDGGRTFTTGNDGLAPVNDQLVENVESSEFGDSVLSYAAVGSVELVGTSDGAFYSTDGAALQPVPGTQGLTVQVAHATDDGILIGTSRGLLRFRPGRPDSLRPEQDIPPFLAVGAMEVPETRPNELYMATAVKPYPVPPPAPLTTAHDNQASAVRTGLLAGLVAAGAVAAAAALRRLVRRR